MKKYVLGAVLSIGLLVSPALTQASGLTSSQVQAILSILSSFGADQSVINNVQASLTGGTTTVKQATDLSKPRSESENTIINLTNALLSKTSSGSGISKDLLSSGSSEVTKDIQIAKQRGQLMMQLAETDPEAFLRNVIPEATRSKLSTDVQKEVEQKVSLTGKIESFYIDDFKNENNSKVKYFLNSGNARLSVEVAGDLPVMMSGSSVRVDGYQLNQTLVADVKSNGIRETSQAVTTDAVGEQKTLVILVTKPGYTIPATKEEMKNTIFSGDFEKFYEEQSYGKIWFTGDVTDWISVPDTVYFGEFSPSLDQQEVKDYIIQKGIDLSNYDHVMFIPSGWEDNRASGVSTLGKGDVSFNNVTYNLSLGYVPRSVDNEYAYTKKMSKFEYIFSHEMGHGLGLTHAKALSCSGPSLDINCSELEYGNLYDTMGDGSNSSHFNSHYKDLLGWLDTSSKISITKSGTYFLSPLELKTGVRMAVVTNPALPSQGPIYIEFRRSVGYDDMLKNTEEGLQLNNLITPTIQGTTPYTLLINPNSMISYSPSEPQVGASIFQGGSFAWDSKGIQIDSVTITPTLATFDIKITNPVKRVPIAKITVNQFSSTTVEVGGHVMWEWSSSYGDSYSSKRSIKDCTEATKNMAEREWLFNNHDGLSVETFDSSYAGCTIIAKYTVTGAGGTTTAQAILKINSDGKIYPPKIGSFIVNGGTSVTLTSGIAKDIEVNWSGITGATSCSLAWNNGGGVPSVVQLPMGIYSIPTASVWPPATYTLTLTCGNGTTTTSKLISVTVNTGTVVTNPTATLTINNLSSATVNVGDPFAWSWDSTGGTKYSSTYSTTGCTKASTNTNGDIAWVLNTAKGISAGTIDPAWAGCTVIAKYTVTNGNINKTSTATLKINPVVVVSVPTIGSFTVNGATSANFTNGTAGDAVVAWSGITGATSCSLAWNNGGGVPSSVSIPSGSYTFTNASVWPAATYTLTLTCNGLGDTGVISATKSVSVTVYPGHANPGSSSQSASALDGFTSATQANVAQPTTNTVSKYGWNRNLEIGSSYTADVSAPQTALTHEGLYTGEITGGFYNQTFTSVKAFQQKYGIDTGTNGAGFVGLKTREKLNSLY